jgi:hypothetical protein
MILMSSFYILVPYFLFICITRFHGPGITVHCPFTQPQCPAPQSIGPLHSSVQSSVQAPFEEALMQLVGWQHWAGTQSESLVQAVISWVGVGVGVPKPGPVTQPVTMTKSIRTAAIIRICHRNFVAMCVKYLTMDINLLAVNQKTAMGSRRFELLTSAMSRRRHNQLDHEPGNKMRLKG